MTGISTRAVAARESARHSSGRFGEQARDDPGQLHLNPGCEPPDPGPRQREWTVSPGQFAAMAAKVEKLNERAARKGVTGRFGLSGTERVVVEERDGLRVETVVVDARLAGDPPSYAGWRFVGTLEQVETGPDTSEFIIRTQPGAEDTGVDRSTIRPGVCDHCGSARSRGRLYLVRNDKGESRQVGTTCVKDFLGWDVVPPLLDTDAACDSLGQFSNRVEDEHPTRFTVAVALAAVAEYGWHPSYAERPTSLVVAEALSRGHEGEKVRRALAGRMGEAATQAPAVIADLLGGLDQSTDYGQNLAVALRAPATTPGRRALVVSSVAAWKRLRGEQLRAARDAASDWVGRPGDKVQLNVTVERADTVDGYAYQSTQRMLLMRDGGGNVLKAYSAARWTYDVGPGDTFTLDATVKKHDEYRGTRQTTVTRVKRGKG